MSTFRIPASLVAALTAATLWGCTPKTDIDTADTDAMTHVALVRGSLYTSDMAEAQVRHDAVAVGGESAARALGDIGHEAFLGTTLLGTTENEFMALDRWSALGGMNTLYTNPDFQAAFGTLFAAQPTLEAFTYMPAWYSWGSLDAGDGSSSHYYVVVRGRLASSDPATAQATHDAVASGGEAAATVLGDVAHVVFVGAADPQEFLAIDVWTSSANIETLYTNPDFQAAFASLLDMSTVSIGVYASTAWYGW